MRTLHVNVQLTDGDQLPWPPSSLNEHSHILSFIASTWTTLRGLGKRALDPQEKTLLSSQILGKLKLEPAQASSLRKPVGG